MEKNSELRFAFYKHLDYGKGNLRGIKLNGQLYEVGICLDWVECFLL